MSIDGSELSAGTVAAEIEMSRLNWVGSFLVVEGHSDSRFWRSRICSVCDIVIAKGRAMVIEALSLLNSRELAGVLGAVDDDFDHLLGRALEVPNIVRTDPRDLEGILLRSGALEKVLGEFGDPARIAAFLTAEPGTIRSALLRRADLFGRIRWLNELAAAQVSLDSLKPQRFCNVPSWTYDRAGVIQESIRLGVSANAAELEARLAALPAADPWHVCRGHDLVDVLIGGLLGVLGGRANKPFVEALLRSGIENSEFQRTLVYSRVREWEHSNDKFKVLPQAENVIVAP